MWCSFMGCAFDWDVDGDLPMIAADLGPDGSYRPGEPDPRLIVRHAWLDARVRVRLEGGGTTVAACGDMTPPSPEGPPRVWLWPESFASVPRALLDDAVRPRLRALALMGRKPDLSDPAMVARVKAMRDDNSRGSCFIHNLESLQVLATHPEDVAVIWHIWTPTFDWMSWSSTPRGTWLLNNFAPVANATIDELVGIMMTWWRYFRQQQTSLDPEFPVVGAVAARAATILRELDRGVAHPTELLAIHDLTKLGLTE